MGFIESLVFAIVILALIYLIRHIYTKAVDEENEKIHQFKLDEMQVITTKNGTRIGWIKGFDDSAVEFSLLKCSGEYRKVVIVNHEDIISHYRMIYDHALIYTS